MDFNSLIYSGSEVSSTASLPISPMLILILTLILMAYVAIGFLYPPLTYEVDYFFRYAHMISKRSFLIVLTYLLFLEISCTNLLVELYVC